jgi:hypothetical protein
MAIRTLSRQEFDRFRSARTTMARRLTDKAVEWFADDMGAVLGAIAYDEGDLDWSFVILGRDNHGQFCVLGRDVFPRCSPELTHFCSPKVDHTRNTISPWRRSTASFSEVLARANRRWLEPNASAFGS